MMAVAVAASGGGEGGRWDTVFISRDLMCNLGKLPRTSQQIQGSILDFPLELSDQHYGNLQHFLASLELLQQHHLISMTNIKYKIAPRGRSFSDLCLRSAKFLDLPQFLLR